jgi:hypothetical protein
MIEYEYEDVKKEVPKEKKKGCGWIVVFAVLMSIACLAILWGYANLKADMVETELYVEEFCLTNHLRVDGLRYEVSYGEILYINTQGEVFFNTENPDLLFYTKDGKLFFTSVEEMIE